MNRSAILLPLAAALLTLMPGGTSLARTGPFDPCTATEVNDPTPEATSEIELRFGLGLAEPCTEFTSPGDPQYYFDALAFFTPPEWGIARDSEIPDGAKVGHFSQKMPFGLVNNPCNNVLTVPMVLYEATTNGADFIDAKPPGTPNRLLPLAEDDDDDGAPNGAEKWPSYLDSVMAELELDASSLVARYVGMNSTTVPGMAMIVNFLVFDPGANMPGGIPSDPRLGYPTVMIFQDPTGLPSPKDPVNDICAAPYLARVILNGQVNDAPYRRNPPDGTYNFTTYATSLPDEDLDGIENALDTCPTDPNDSGWNPRGDRIQPADPDADGIPNDCDPTPDTREICFGTLPDEDCDDWPNNSDNCPLDPNPHQEDADGDDLGDACDPEPNVSPPQISWCGVSRVVIGSGGAEPPDPNTMSPCGAPVMPSPAPTMIPGELPDGGGAPDQERAAAWLPLAAAAVGAGAVAIWRMRRTRT